jgi:AcrR family transcriptional regulator
MLKMNKKIKSMRNIQTVALELFNQFGYEKVSIQQIAAEAEVGPATIYRYFKTKEGIILWDQYEPALFTEIRSHLGSGKELIPALLDALISALEPIYEKDSERILNRSQLIVSIPSVWSAWLAEQAELRAGLFQELKRAKISRSDIELEVLAGAITVALETAVVHWTKAHGKLTLQTLLSRALQGLTLLN